MAVNEGGRYVRKSKGGAAKLAHRTGARQSRYPRERDRQRLERHDTVRSAESVPQEEAAGAGDDTDGGKE